MKKILKLSVFANALVSMWYACAMNENIIQDKKSTISNTEHSNVLTCDAKNDETGKKYGGLKRNLRTIRSREKINILEQRWKPDENTEWEWTSEELDDELNVIYNYAENEVKKVISEYNEELKRGGFEAIRDDFHPYLWSHGSIKILAEKAKREETEFSIHFAKNRFIAFLIAWNYFCWRACPDGKHRLFPSIGPEKEVLRRLYNEFKNGDFLGRQLSKNKSHEEVRKNSFFSAIEEGKKHYHNLMN